MSWLSTVLKFFTGNSGEKIINMADEAVFTQEEKAVEDGKFTTSILNDTSVDMVNRWIRPGVTLWLIGGLSGCWKLPDTSTVDPVWFQIFMIVITFWFGGRVLLKDLPNTINAILKIKRG